MKSNFFNLLSVKNGIRQGSIGGTPTPNFLCYTQKGAVPIISKAHYGYLNHKLFEFIYPDLAFEEDVFEQYSQFKKSNQTQSSHTQSQLSLLNDFFGLRENDEKIFLSFVDPFEVKVENSSKCTDKIDVFVYSERKSVSMEDYLKFVKLVQPFFFQIPIGSLLKTSGRKLRKRIVSQTQNFIKTCITLKKEMEIETPMIAPIVTEEHKYEHYLNCTELTNYAADLDGFAITALEKYNYGERDSILKKVISDLQNENKLRLYQSKGNPIEVLFGIRNGMDLFESSYVLSLTNKDLAINLNFEDFNPQNPNSNLQSLEETKVIDSLQPKDYIDKVINTIDIQNPIYNENMEPISKTCTCFTCKSHTLAYMHHLYLCKEMNLKILLYIHNLHAYSEFFTQIRQSIENDCFYRFTSWFLTTQCKPKELGKQKKPQKQIKGKNKEKTFIKE